MSISQIRYFTQFFIKMSTRLKKKGSFFSPMYKRLRAKEPPFYQKMNLSLGEKVILFLLEALVD